MATAFTVVGSLALVIGAILAAIGISSLYSSNKKHQQDLADVERPSAGRFSDRQQRRGEAYNTLEKRAWIRDKFNLWGVGFGVVGAALVATGVIMGLD